MGGIINFPIKLSDVEEMKVTVCRQWNDHRKIKVNLSALSGFHISKISGGVQARSPYPMLYAYMACDNIPESKEFAHSCKHTGYPHRIKVCITQKHNSPALYRKLRRMIEPDWKRNK